MKKHAIQFKAYLMGALLLPILLSVSVSVRAADYSYLTYLLRIRYLSDLSFNLPSRDLNGTALNGLYLDERFVTSVSLDNVRMKNGRFQSLRLLGTAFVPGGQVEGAEFEATLDDGNMLTLRVDKVKPSNTGWNRDVVRYEVSYDSVEGWKPLCGTDLEGKPVAAIPLLGIWDYSAGTTTGGSHTVMDRAFTFACEGYVLEKCVAAGYKPWSSVLACTDRHRCNWMSIAPYHQACTRMLRADFCGDGTSYTENNVLVALFDGLGIRVDTEEWNIEAEWDEDGAVCSASPRIASLVPTCGESLADETCGDKSHFQDGILIISELP